MNLKKEIEKNKDIAWENLYSRLHRDGLLPEETLKKPSHIRFNGVQRAAAIAIIIICTVSVLIFKNSSNTIINNLVLYNEAGSPTLVTTLEDGSIVYLSDRTSIHYPEHFADNKREISLQGDAFFEVTGQKDRPFIIETQTTIIEVIGTAFNVKSRDEESFSLSVRHGKVKVTSRNTMESVYVESGHTAFFKNDDLHTLPTEDYSEFEAYMKRIYFKDQTLADVIRFINENNKSVQLQLDDPKLGEKIFTVTFDNNTPDTMAILICKYLNLEYTQKQNVIHISKPK